MKIQRDFYVFQKRPKTAQKKFILKKIKNLYRRSNCPKAPEDFLRERNRNYEKKFGLLRLPENILTGSRFLARRLKKLCFKNESFQEI